MSRPVNDAEIRAEIEAQKHDRGAAYCRRRIAEWLPEIIATGKFRPSTMHSLYELSLKAAWHDAEAASHRRARIEREYEDAYRAANGG